MNKKFNESELEEIMSEIETLEKEFSKVDDDAPQSSDVLRRLTEMTVEEATARGATIHQFQKEPSQKTHETAMSFKVSGQMSLNLNIELAGKMVNISVDEGEGLIIELEDGMRFQVPVSDTSSYKKAA